MQEIFLIDPILIGYFPKKRQRETSCIKHKPRVEEICSVSECISEAPDDWIEKWKHNEMLVYDDPQTAWSIVPESQRPEFALYAYKILPVEFGETGEKEMDLPPLHVTPMGRGFEFLGYDAVSKCYAAHFECSPLSCNGLAEKFPVNRYCLVDSLDEAIELARACIKGPAEPGPYYVVSVWRKSQPSTLA